MIISLSGLPGAGKSTVKNLLAQRLHHKTYSMGDMRGKLALSQGITIDALNALGMDTIATDQAVDAFQKHLGETENDFIIDGWLSWYFIPQSFKIFLTVEPQQAAERIFQDRYRTVAREDEPLYRSVEETKEILEKRVRQNQERYQKWYHLDFLNLAHYDLVLDTTHLTPPEVVSKILAAIKIPA